VKEYIIYFCLALLLFTCLQSVQANGIGSPVIEGRLYLVGNEPFTELAIETEAGEVYALRGHLVNELKNLQGQWMKLGGRIITGQHFSYTSQGFLVETYGRILPGEGANE